MDHIEDGISNILVGIDLVSIRRFQRFLQKFDMAIKQHIFTAYELEECGQAMHRLASRYAAKEATSKALQVGLAHMSSQGIHATDVEVRTHQNGAPFLQLYGWAKQLAQSKQIQTLSVSISHERQYAIAMVTGIRS